MNLSRSPWRNWSMWTVLGLFLARTPYPNWINQNSQAPCVLAWPHGSSPSLFSLDHSCCLWSVTGVHCEVFSMMHLKTLLLMSVMNVIISSSRINHSHHSKPLSDVDFCYDFQHPLPSATSTSECQEYLRDITHSTSHLPLYPGLSPSSGCEPLRDRDCLSYRSARW